MIFVAFFLSNLKPFSADGQKKALQECMDACAGKAKASIPEMMKRISENLRPLMPPSSEFTQGTLLESHSSAPSPSQMPGMGGLPGGLGMPGAGIPGMSGAGIPGMSGGLGGGMLGGGMPGGLGGGMSGGLGGGMPGGLGGGMPTGMPELSDDIPKSLG